MVYEYDVTPLTSFIRLLFSFNLKFELELDVASTSRFSPLSTTEVKPEGLIRFTSNNPT